MTASYPADPGNDGARKGWAAADFPDADWPLMKLPAPWTARGHSYSGVFWFRREIDVPAGWAGQDLMLRIGAVDKQDTTYFNGEQVGATGRGLEDQHWNTLRQYRVPGHLARAGRNVIAVRAYSFIFDGGMIGPADQMYLSAAESSSARVSLAGEWRYRIEHNFGEVLPAQFTRSAGPGCPNTLHILFDNKIAPLLPYALRGAIWYQGESNTAAAAAYRRQLKELIRDWRFYWGQGDFPFLIVQLANFQAPQSFDEFSSWALLREAQLKTLSEPETGLAVTIDVGEAGDIHPTNKQDVGHRLAQWALARTYGKPIVPSGPLYAGMIVEGDRIRIRFDHTGGGLVSRGGPLKCFFIADANKNFVEAAADISGDTVVVHHAQIKEPASVRYAWAGNPDGCNLYNAEGLPASPFRTDDW
jgi:sialate O-acetylesterase